VVDDPIEMEDESALPGLGQMIYQLIEENSDLDSVRVIASKVDNHSRVKVINVVWGNRVLADAIMDHVNDRELVKYELEPPEIEDEDDE
jgi:hypothetical protein